MARLSLLPLRLWPDRRWQVLFNGGIRCQQSKISLMQGIVPISCEEIFTRIAKNDNPNKEFEVQVSMMEIYNEKVQDLLIPIAKRPKEGHKIREHKTLGIYVEGMSKHFVDTYEPRRKYVFKKCIKLGLI